MLTCYVSIPVGIRDDAEGRMLDFDYLYDNVIRPAVEELNMDCRRLDDIVPGAIWHKTLFTTLISSDLMIADVSTHSANVLYELGIRHALRRGRTLLIQAGGRLPANISYIQSLWYQPDEAGRLTGLAAAKFRESLQAAIRQSQRSTISDSPLYEFFPDLDVILPPELEHPGHTRRSTSSRKLHGFTQSIVESPTRALDELRKNQEAVLAAPQPDPVEYLTLLRKFRDLSDWDRVISLAQGAPPAIVESPEVRQLLALALNRRGKSGDQDFAITIMQQLIAETGGDSETFGVLGRIYKDRYDDAKRRHDTPAAADHLENALHYYRQGFEKNPKEYYCGINVVTLLLEQNDEAAQAELKQIVPRVQAAVQERLDSEVVSFWDLATDLQLAVVARDWGRAAHAAQQAVAMEPSGWMIETTLRDLHATGEKLNNAEDRSRVMEILVFLQQAKVQAEATDAYHG